MQYESNPSSGWGKPAGQTLPDQRIYKFLDQTESATPTFNVDNTLAQCWADVEPASATLVQHQLNTVSMYRLCWEKCHTYSLHIQTSGICQAVCSWRGPTSPSPLPLPVQPSPAKHRHLSQCSQTIYTNPTGHDVDSTSKNGVCPGEWLKPNDWYQLLGWPKFCAFFFVILTEWWTRIRRI